MGLFWEDRAWEEYCYWQLQDKKTLRRINLLLKDIQRNNFDGIGNPEALRENYSGWWSRRIDNENRIVYKIKDGTVIIASCKGHYED